MARKCVNCETRKGMTRFEGETFTIEHAGPDRCDSSCRSR